MDEPVTVLLERTASGLHVPGDLLERISRRRTTRQTRRRLGVRVLALTIAIGGLAVAFVAFGGTRSKPADGTGLTRYGDPTGQWTISYPNRYQHGSISNIGISQGEKGIWVADFAQPAFGEGGQLPVAFPRNGAMVTVSQVIGGSFLGVGPDTPLPIAFSDLTSPRGDPRPRNVAWRSATVVADGQTYYISARLGAAVSDADRRAVADIISSFRPLPTRPGGTIDGSLLYYVLASPSAYPVGSVTRFDAHNLPRSPNGRPFPFYLVHATEGFYALAWPGILHGGYKDCAVTYDSAASRFSCPNGARWALDGSVIAKPGPAFRDDRLAVLPVRFSHDGRVLVSPNLFLNDTRTDLQLTGP